MDRRGVAAADSMMPWGSQEPHRRLGCQPPGIAPWQVPSGFRLPGRRTQQSGHFFLNVDDDFRFTQFFTELLIFTTQLLVFLVQGVARGLGAALLWGQGLQDSGGSFLPPRYQVRGVQTLTAEQATDATWLLFGLIGRSQDTLLVCGGEDAPLGSSDDLRVGPVGTSPARARCRTLFVLGQVGPTALDGRGRRVCLRSLHC